MKRVLEKMYAVEGHRGLVMSEHGPGIRVKPEEFEAREADILDDGTEQGRQDCRRCILRALGKPYDVTGAPSDMSRAAVQQMLFRKASWDVAVIHPKMTREPGVKQWRVLANRMGLLHPSKSSTEAISSL